MQAMPIEISLENALDILETPASDNENAQTVAARPVLQNELNSFVLDTPQVTIMIHLASY